MTTSSWIQEMEERRTDLGVALYIRIARYDGRPMPWTEVWERFAAAYPGRWAVQTFPPEDCLLDEVNYYHLFVLESPPRGLRIDR